MSKTRGLLINCARCNNMIFLKFLERIPMDGGISHYDQYQDLPKSWIKDNHFGHLCPKCAGEFTRRMNEFFDGCSIAPEWQSEYDDSCESAYVNLYMIKENNE